MTTPIKACCDGVREQPELGPLPAQGLQTSCSKHPEKLFSRCRRLDSQIALLLRRRQARLINAPPIIIVVLGSGVAVVAVTDKKLPEYDVVRVGLLAKSDGVQVPLGQKTA